MTCINIDKSQKQVVKYFPHDTIYMKFLKIQSNVTYCYGHIHVL